MAASAASFSDLAASAAAFSSALRASLAARSSAFRASASALAAACSSALAASAAAFSSRAAFKLSPPETISGEKSENGLKLGATFFVSTAPDDTASLYDGSEKSTMSTFPPSADNVIVGSSKVSDCVTTVQ